MVVSAGMGDKTVQQYTLIHSSNTEYLFYFRTKFSLSHPSVLAATHHGRVELDDKAGTSSLKAEWVVTAIRLILWGDMEGSLTDCFHTLWASLFDSVTSSLYSTYCISVYSQSRSLRKQKCLVKAQFLIVTVS